MAREKCQFYLPQKRRNCKFDVVHGKKWCGNHLPLEQDGRARVPCPWDPTGAHDIFEDEVERHKLRCPAYLQLQAQHAAPYFRLDVNAGPAAACDPLAGTGEGSVAARRAMLAAGLGPVGLDDLLSRIAATAAELAPLPPVAALNQESAHPPPPAPGATQPPYSAKHAAQQASIAGHLERYGLLHNAEHDVFVELGAGRGYLGAALVGHCPALSTLVLVDCRGFKLKADRALRHMDLHRLRCDLKDFFVPGCPGLAAAGAEEAGCGGAAGTPTTTSTSRRWVGAAKHLCGAASDFGLRAAVEQGGARCRGLGIATCCHHRCSWRAYVAKDWFLANGFSPVEFELVSWMTGWALCGHEAPAGTGAEAQEEGEEEGHGGKERTAPTAPTPARTTPDTALQPPAGQRWKAGGGGDGEGNGASYWQPHHHLPRPARVAVGQQCKALIDAGRLAYLRESGGMQAELVPYICPTVSGENKLLLGRRAEEEQMVLQFPTATTTLP